MTLHTGAQGPPIRANNMETEVFRQIINSEQCGSAGVVGITGTGPPTGDYAVTQNGTPNMSVNVASGFAFVPGTNNSPVQGMYHVYNDATVNLAVAASDPTNPRIDLVVLAIQDAFYAGATNTPVLSVITGTPAPSPVAPSAPANSITLAQIAVAAGVTSIVTANITEGRTSCLTVLQARGLLPGGYASVTSNQGSIGSGGAALTNLSVTVTVAANRRIRVKGYGIMSCTAAANVEVNIYESATQLVEDIETVSTGQFATCKPEIVLTPSSGSHTYHLVGLANAGTGTLNAGSGLPAWISAEDVGAVI